MRKKQIENRYRIVDRRPGIPGFRDLTKEGVDPIAGEKFQPRQSNGKSVESALLELCREIAATILRGLQEGQDPVRLKKELSANLKNVGDFSDAQAESLVALAIELIRATSQGDYRKDPREISSLVSRALGQECPERWN